MPQYNSRSRSRRGPSHGKSSSSYRPHSGSRGGGKKKRGETISIDKYINTKIVENQQSEYKSERQFADFGLNPVIVENLKSKGYETPTAIQDQTIPYILEGRDIVGLANTGTGKTGAFVLPIIHKAVEAHRPNHTLIITPTRELAEQVDDELFSFTKGLKLYSAVCVGGMNITNQIREIRRGVHVIIGTPGRLKDLIDKGLLDISKIDMLVLDEADQMLDMGFLPDVKEIISHTPAGRQVLCFSATMDARIAGLIKEMQEDPITVSVLQKQTSQHIYQDIVRSRDSQHKYEQLTTLLQEPEFEKILVFAETKHGVQRISDNLNKSGLASESIHGNKNQSQRRKALGMFKKNQVRVLVATDVAARGLDIPQVDLVVNYDEPNTHDTYIHRIGRTGRAGKNGHARTFVS